MPAAIPAHDARLALPIAEIDCRLFQGPLSVPLRRRRQRQGNYPPSIKLGPDEFVLAHRLAEFLTSIEQREARRHEAFRERASKAGRARWTRAKAEAAEAATVILSKRAPSTAATPS